MALGNNLKKIKKDSLIPTKKVSEQKPKAKPVIKAKPKNKVKNKAKTVTKTVPKAKTEKIKPSVKKTSKVDSKAIKPQVNKPIEHTHVDERFLVGGTDGAPITAKLIPSRRKTVRKTKLIFEGSLSLQEADIIKNCLLTTFTDYDIIDIQLINITQLDIIPIQLLKAFVNSYANKKVKIDSDVPFDIKIILERAGFGSFMFKEEAA